MEIRTMFFFFVSAVITVTSVLTNDYEKSCFVAPSDPRTLAKHYLEALKYALAESFNAAYAEPNRPRMLQRLDEVRKTLKAFEFELTDCFSNSNEYTGKRNCTLSGRECMHWDSADPHEHAFEKFPDGSVQEAGNYCRDPSGEGVPWCFTMDPSVRHETCFVPRCDALQ